MPRVFKFLPSKRLSFTDQCGNANDYDDDENDAGILLLQHHYCHYL